MYSKALNEWLMRVNWSSLLKASMPHGFLLINEILCSSQGSLWSVAASSAQICPCRDDFFRAIFQKVISSSSNSDQSHLKMINLWRVRGFSSKLFAEGWNQEIFKILFDKWQSIYLNRSLFERCFLDGWNFINVVTCWGCNQWEK